MCSGWRWTSKATTPWAQRRPPGPTPWCHCTSGACQVSAASAWGQGEGEGCPGHQVLRLSGEPRPDETPASAPTRPSPPLPQNPGKGLPTTAACGIWCSTRCQSPGLVLQACRGQWGPAAAQPRSTAARRGLLKPTGGLPHQAGSCPPGPPAPPPNVQTPPTSASVLDEVCVYLSRLQILWVIKSYFWEWFLSYV